MDASRFEQILGNLSGYALRYTPGNESTVSLRVVGDAVRCEATAAGARSLTDG